MQMSRKYIIKESFFREKIECMTKIKSNNTFRRDERVKELDGGNFYITSYNVDLVICKCQTSSKMHEHYKNTLPCKRSNLILKNINIKY